jgi:glucosyl-dolichyl phosphate glucuronosyltransferase
VTVSIPAPRSSADLVIVRDPEDVPAQDVPTAVTATVVVCAYTMRRWNDLVASLRSAAGQDPAPAEILLVVDHNDELYERSVTEFAEAAGAGGSTAVQVLRNTQRRGLSGARNTAIAAATADVVVFLDDDAAARPGWLAGLMRHYADERVLAVGGAARPAFPGERPRTLPASGPGARGELDWVVGCTYTGQPTAPADVRNLMGCNMSFRRSVFAEIGGFSEMLGRIGRTPLGCEETELCIRARQHDRSARIVFEPAALVDHRVSSDRLTWRYLLSRCWAEGVSKAAVSRLVGSGDALSTERGYAGRILPVAVGRELRAALASPGRAASAAAVVAALGATSAGYLRGRFGSRSGHTR